MCIGICMYTHKYIHTKHTNTLKYLKITIKGKILILGKQRQSLLTLNNGKWKGLLYWSVSFQCLKVP